MGILTTILDVLQSGGWGVGAVFVLFYYLNLSKHEKQIDRLMSKLDISELDKHEELNRRHDQVLDCQRETVTVASGTRELLQKVEDTLQRYEGHVISSKELASRILRAIEKCEDRQHDICSKNK